MSKKQAQLGQKGVTEAQADRIRALINDALGEGAHQLDLIDFELAAAERGDVASLPFGSRWTQAEALGQIAEDAAMMDILLERLGVNAAAYMSEGQRNRLDTVRARADALMDTPWTRVENRDASEAHIDLHVEALETTIDAVDEAIVSAEAKDVDIREPVGVGSLIVAAGIIVGGYFFVEAVF